MIKTTSCRHTLQTNSDESRFHKRPDGLERFIPNPRPRETYMVIRRWMNVKTRTCFPGVRDIAERAGIDVSTVRRHLIILARLGVLIVTRRRIGHRSNLSNLYTFPLLNEDFMRQKMRGGYSQNARVKQLPEIKEPSTTARAPEARRSNDTWTPDRETYKPRPRFSHWREWREKCERRRLQTALNASIGVYEGPRVEISEEEAKREAEEFNRKEREAKEARDREAERKRMEYEEYKKKQAESIAEGPDENATKIMERINRKIAMYRRTNEGSNSEPSSGGR